MFTPRSFGKVGVEAYAAYALRAWLTREDWISGRTRRFARCSAIFSFALGMAGQVAYHLLAQAGSARAPVAHHHPRVVPAGPGPGHGDRASPHAACRRSHRARRAGPRWDRRTSSAPVRWLVRRGPGGTGPGPERSSVEVRGRSPSQDQNGPHGGPRHRRRDRGTDPAGDRPGAPDRQQAYRSGKTCIAARLAQRGNQGLQPGPERPGGQD
jgi:hypothetical protein